MEDVENRVSYLSLSGNANIDHLASHPSFSGDGPLSAKGPKLASRRDNDFPVPFNFEGVKRLDCQPIGIPPSRNDTEDGRYAASVRSNLSQNSRTSGPSMTPTRREGRNEKNAKGWLLGWLVGTGSFYCHITEFKPCCRLMVQLAHVVPKADSGNTLLLSAYEYILGMQNLALCINSRLFLIPLKATVHHLLDDHVFIIVPCLPLLFQMHQYFLDLFGAKGSLDQNKREGAKKRWVELRRGDLAGFSEFKDGNIHQFYAVPHAGTFSEVREELGSFSSTGFYSQVSPFAALLNAFRSLSVWKDGLQCDSFNPKSSPRLFDALQEAQILEAERITETIASIHSLLMLLLGQFWSDRQTDGGSKTKRKGGSENERRRDESRGGGKDGGKDSKKLEKFGFDHDLIFYGRDRDGDNGSGTGAVDAGESMLSLSSPSQSTDKDLPVSFPKSTDSDIPEEPREGAELFLVNNDSVGSTWSNDSVRGFSALEPDFHNPSNGLSPAQRIAKEWRQANPHLTMATKSTNPPPAPYARSFASSTTVTPTLPLSKHLSPTRHQTSWSKHIARRKWVSKTPTAPAKTQVDVLRILGLH